MWKQITVGRRDARLLVLLLLLLGLALEKSVSVIEGGGHGFSVCRRDTDVVGQGVCAVIGGLVGLVGVPDAVWEGEALVGRGVAVYGVESLCTMWLGIMRVVWYEEEVSCVDCISCVNLFPV